MNAIKNLVSTLLRRPRLGFAAIAVICLIMTLMSIFYFTLYLELEPCPMCIVQRMCVIVGGIFCAAAAIFCKTPLGWRAWGIPALLVTGFGASTAARQSWLQWNPPEFSTCGRGDIYGMITDMPLSRAIPKIFEGTGDCSVVEWSFLGGSIANWSLLWFIVCVAALLALLVRGGKAAH
ncbi:MAG: disulfide bond formation protein B [Ottowia sp.]|nr:disulfide bond formation protein B [Ottowia sp.]